AGIAQQSAENDPRIQQALVTEVRQLRMAIERYTLLGTRTQLAVSQVQLQEARVSRLAKDLEDVRGMLEHGGEGLTRMQEEVRNGEAAITSNTNPGMRGELETRLRQFKWEIETAAATQKRLAAREGELAAQLQAAQREMQDS